MAKIIETTQLMVTRPVIPQISGARGDYGTHQHMLDPDRSVAEGYKLSDTWGA